MKLSKKNSAEKNTIVDARVSLNKSTAKHIIRSAAKNYFLFSVVCASLSQLLCKQTQFLFWCVVFSTKIVFVSLLLSSWLFFLSFRNEPESIGNEGGEKRCSKHEFISSNSSQFVLLFSLSTFLFRFVVALICLLLFRNVFSSFFLCVWSFSASPSPHTCMLLR